MIDLVEFNHKRLQGFFNDRKSMKFNLKIISIIKYFFEIKSSIQLLEIGED